MHNHGTADSEIHKKLCNGLLVVLDHFDLDPIKYICISL